MEAEIVFSGLCAFHNVHDTNKTMPEPSVIVIRTDDPVADSSGSITEEASVRSSKSPFYSPQVETIIRKRWEQKRKRDSKEKLFDDEGPEAEAPDVHIPHLSFDSTKVRVNDEARALFQDVVFAPEFKSLPLNGVEIEIVTDPPGKPKVDESYDRRVVQKDQYWPEAKNRWNRAFVPKRNKQPKRSAVVGFMRFGSGTISAGIDSPRPWRFVLNGEVRLEGTFATEVIYDRFPHSGDKVELRLRDVETREVIRELSFSPLPNTDKVTLFIGNNDSDDIDDAVQRLKAQDVKDNVHFKFLNRVTSVVDPGLIPIVVRDRNERPNPDNSAGVTTGPCGPVGSNGGK